MTDPTQAPPLHRLAEFTGRGYDKGRGRLMCAAWALVAEPAQRSVLMPPRLRALLRRSGASAEQRDELLEVGDLRMNEDSHEVWRGEDEIQLTATEFELLRYLMRNPRRVLSKPQILDRVWNYDFGGQANIVELYISYLRRKIDKGREPMIHTMRGVGYVLKPATGTDERS